MASTPQPEIGYHRELRAWCCAAATLSRCWNNCVGSSQLHPTDQLLLFNASGQLQLAEQADGTPIGAESESVREQLDGMPIKVIIPIACDLGEADPIRGRATDQPRSG